MFSNNSFKKKINKDVSLSLSVPSNVGGVMGGSYNSLMFGNAIETAFYRSELGKDIRMWSFYCKNISANLLGKAKPFLKTQQLVLILCKKSFSLTPKLYPPKGELFLFMHLNSILLCLFANDHIPVKTGCNCFNL